MTDQTNHSLPAERSKGTRQSGGRLARLSRWAFAIRASDARGTALVKTVTRVLLIMMQEFKTAHISIRAASLTYAIILSMVPMLAMSTAVLKGLGSDNQLKQVAERFIDQLEPDPPASSWPAGENGTGTDTSNSLTGHLRNAVDTIFDYVDKTNFAAIGIFGIIGLLVAVVLVLGTVENAMNAIWHTEKGRSLFRKIMDYLALLILLPISINAALAGDAILESQKIMGYINTIIPADWVVKMLLKLLPFLFVVISLMVMYLFFPHTKVKTYAALSGALFASVFWFIVQKIYIVLQIGVANYNAIYGSFATVPLFLIWLQIGWTFILLGATLAYAIQNRNHYRRPGADISPQRQLQLALDILDTVYANFAARSTTSLVDLAERIPQVRQQDIASVSRQLVAGNILWQQGDVDEVTLVPATPAEKLHPGEVVQVILGSEPLPSPGGRLACRALTAAGEAIKDHPFFGQDHTVEKSHGT